jgi:DNA-binding CsgD family transcriptional regulator
MLNGQDNTSEFESYNLSDREQEILDLIIKGLSNKEIGNYLSISPNTVKIHVSKILRKVGAASRTEAATIALNKAVQKAVPESEYNSTPQVQSIRKTKSMQMRSIGLVIGAILSFVSLSLFFFSGLNKNKPTLESNESRVVFSIPNGGLESTGVVYQDQLYLLANDYDRTSLVKVDLRNQQSQIVSELPVALRGVKLERIRSNLYVAGGQTLDGTASNKLFVYNIVSSKWVQKKDLVQGVWNYASESIDGKLILFGGENTHGLVSDVWEYDPSLDTWTLLGNLIQSRKKIASLRYNDRFYILGGEDQHGPSMTVEAFSEVLAFQDQHREMEDSILPVPCRVCSAAVSNATPFLYLNGVLYRFDAIDAEWKKVSTVQNRAIETIFLVKFENSLILVEQINDSNSSITWFVPEYRINLPLLLNN